MELGGTEEGSQWDWVGLRNGANGTGWECVYGSQWIWMGVKKGICWTGWVGVRKGVSGTGWE